MKIHATVGGKEITNPFAKTALGFCALAVASALVAVVVFIVLPLVGITLGWAVGLLSVATIVLMLAMPDVLVFGQKARSTNK